MPETAPERNSRTGWFGNVRQRLSRVGWKRSILVPLGLLYELKPYVVRGWVWLGEIETARFAYETALFLKVIFITMLTWWISAAHDWSQWAVPLICFGLLSYLVVGPELQPNQVHRFAHLHLFLREEWHWIFAAVIILFVLPSFVTVPSTRATTSTQVTKRPAPNSRPLVIGIGAESPIDKLSELGWTIDRSTNELRFE